MIAPKTRTEIMDNMDNITEAIDRALSEIQRLELLAADNCTYADEIMNEIDLILDNISEMEDRWEFLNNQLAKESV